MVVTSHWWYNTIAHRGSVCSGTRLVGVPSRPCTVGVASRVRACFSTWVHRVIAFVSGSDGRDWDAALLHVDEAIAGEVALMDALGHTQVVEERKKEERVAKRDSPFQDSYKEDTSQPKILSCNSPKSGLTSDVSRLEKRDCKRNGEQDENGGDDALYDVRDSEFAELHKVVAYPAVLQGLRVSDRARQMQTRRDVPR